MEWAGCRKDISQQGQKLYSMNTFIFSHKFMTFNSSVYLNLVYFAAMHNMLAWIRRNKQVTSISRVIVLTFLLFSDIHCITLCTDPQVCPQAQLDLSFNEQTHQPTRFEQMWTTVYTCGCTKQANVSIVIQPPPYCGNIMYHTSQLAKKTTQLVMWTFSIQFNGKFLVPS